MPVSAGMVLLDLPQGASQQAAFLGHGGAFEIVVPSATISACHPAANSLSSESAAVSLRYQGTGEDQFQPGHSASGWLVELESIPRQARDVRSLPVLGDSSPLHGSASSF